MQVWLRLKLVLNAPDCRDLVVHRTARDDVVHRQSKNQRVRNRRVLHGDVSLD